MTVDGYFSLKQLLARGVYIGGVGERNVAAQLLLDGDAGGGVAERRRGSSDRLLPDPAPKSFLYPVAHSGIERSREARRLWGW